MFYNLGNYEQLLLLEEDWDHEGGFPVDKEAYNKFLKFLEALLSNIPNFKEDYEEPEISPVCDGTIDLSFYTTTARLLINIAEKRIGYYGDRYQNIDKIKGQTETFEVTELFEWIKTNLIL